MRTRPILRQPMFSLCTSCACLVTGPKRRTDEPQPTLADTGWRSTGLHGSTTCEATGGEHTLSDVIDHNSTSLYFAERRLARELGRATRSGDAARPGQTIVTEEV